MYLHDLPGYAWGCTAAAAGMPAKGDVCGAKWAIQPCGRGVRLGVGLPSTVQMGGTRSARRFAHGELRACHEAQMLIEWTWRCCCCAFLRLPCAPPVRRSLHAPLQVCAAASHRCWPLHMLCMRASC